MVAMAKRNRESFTARLARRRSWVQAAFLLVWLDPFMLRLHQVCSPVFHCYSCPLATFACPIGVLANFSALHVFPFFAIGLLVVVGAAVGTFLCAWACPFGFLQDLIGKIPTPKFVLPAWTGYTRYVVLIVTVGMVPYLWGEEHALFFCRLCPAGAIESGLVDTAQQAIAGDTLVWPSTVKLVIVGLFLVAMFFTWRPWCRLFCPLGAIYGLFNRVSMLFLRYNSEECNACGRCDRLCKYDVLPDPGLNVSRCIRCLDCTQCRAISLASVVGSPDRTPAGTKPGTDPAKSDSGPQQT